MFDEALNRSLNLLIAQRNKIHPDKPVTHGSK